MRGVFCFWEFHNLYICVSKISTPMNDTSLLSMRILVRMLIFICAFIRTEPASGQIKSSDLSIVDSIRTRKVLVVYETPAQLILERINDIEIMELRYDSILEAYNSRMREAMKLWWPYNKDYEFKSAAEVEAIRKKGGDDYVVIYFSVGMTYNYPYDTDGLIKNEKIYSGLWFTNNSYAFGLKFLNGEKTTEGRSYFCITLIEDYPKKPFIYFSYPSFIPLPGDIKFAFQYLQNTLDHPYKKELRSYMLFTTGPKLITDTLVINRERSNVTQASAIKNYDFPIKYVDQKEFYNLYTQDSLHYTFVFVINVGPRYHEIIMHNDGSLCYDHKSAYFSLELSAIRYMNVWVKEVIDAGD